MPHGVAAVDLASLRAHLAHRGAPLDPAAARFLGRALAATLADAHAAEDAEGNPAPVVRGALDVRVDEHGDVHLEDGPGSEGAAPELREGGRLTPRADVYALGTVVGELLVSAEDPELSAALATATTPDPARRRITCFELSAWLARGLDPEAGRLALAEVVRACLDAAADERAMAPEPPPPSSRPLPVPARLAVALATAAAVFAAGVTVMERWILR